MDIAWTTLLFAGQWALIGLIYFVLFVVLIAVRREMRMRLGRELFAPEPAAARLKIISGGSDPNALPGALVNLRVETRLGADGDCDVVLGDRFVSARHARLRWDGMGWWIEDLGSKNGTFVDGRACPPYQAQPVPIGARLTLGDMTFELEA